MNIRCLFGFHDYTDTGFRRMYGFLYLMQCTRCKKQVEMTDKNISFGSICGQEVMVIKRGEQ
jgi:hypothetical protein